MYTIQHNAIHISLMQLQLLRWKLINSHNVYVNIACSASTALFLNALPKIVSNQK